MIVFSFYLFSICVISGGLFTVISRNPVHSVLWLILSFLSAAGLFVLLGAEFVAMLLIIVYVGAVAVLFLFVVMMLDVDFAELRAGFIKNAGLGAIVGGIVMLELIMVLGFQSYSSQIIGNPAAPAPLVTDNVSNTEALGRILYTKYIFFFQVAGLILLVAMIGAIVLTLRHKEGVRRQSIAVQVARTPETAMEIVKVAPGQSVFPKNEGPAE